MGAAAVLVDTSVWIDHLRGRPVAGDRMRTALAGGQVVMCGPVSAELLQGLDPQARANLWTYLLDLPWAPFERAEWLIAGDLAGDLRAAGTPLPLVDVQIATAAWSIDAALLTRDRDFLAIAAVAPDLRVELVA